MRIIDDFLFITPDKTKAELFLKQMNKGEADPSFKMCPGIVLRQYLVAQTGSSSYGCHVALSKSLCNFVSEHSLPVPMSEVDQRELPTQWMDRAHRLNFDATAFPYCGTLIDPRTLDLKIDVTRSYKTRE